MFGIFTTPSMLRENDSITFCACRRRQKHPGRFSDAIITEVDRIVTT
jgi:hypothetical protein